MFPSGARSEAQRILDRFGTRRAAAAKWLGIATAGRPVLHLVENYAGMVRVAGPRAPEWATAITRRDDVLVFRLDRIGRTPGSSLETVLRHEVVHQVLTHLGGTPLPRWFEEGLCVYHAGTPPLEADFSVERIAAAGNLPSLAETERGFHADARTASIAYKVGHAAVIEFLQRFGGVTLRVMLKRLGEGQSFERAFTEATGVAPQEFEAEWRERVTPSLPFALFVLLENLELTLLCAGALIVAVGYLRWRLRRERAMGSLGE